MKEVLLIMVLSVTVFANEIYTDKNTVWEDAKMISVETNKPITGIFKVFYKNGKSKEEVNYKNGQMDGKIKAWYPTGELMREGQYKDGLLVGIGKQYYNCCKIYYKKASI